MELIQNYKGLDSFPKPTAECRSATYSANGEYFGYTQPTEVVIINCSTGLVLLKIELNDVFDIEFSPNGTYLCLWCKPVLLNKESGVWSKNVKLFNIDTTRIVMEWSNKHQNGWKPQFTSNENFFVKGTFTNKEIEFFDITDSKHLEVIGAPKFKFKTEQPYQSFKISPGLNPSIAIFLPEQGGKPANVSIYNLPNFNQAICSKNFFKAEKCQLKWNSLGTALLALASTDHDTTNKSYYGETNLYLLGIAGAYNSRIDLKKPGPIHDITWSPTAREFSVIYGYMPSETSFFDARGNLIYSLPTLPRNTVLYSPHGKFILVAGFGNLQGTVDVYDRQDKFKKVVSFEAANTSVCEWSPDGRYILTATTSPRLRVDNGLNIWHYTGKLIYHQDYKELFSINWRPQKVEEFPALKSNEPVPDAHESGKSYLLKKQQVTTDVAKRPSGAYRPPHARNNGGSNATTTLYQREMASQLNNTAASPGGVKGNTYGSRVRPVVGAPPPVLKESRSTAKNRKKREAAKAAKDEDSSSPTNVPATAASETSTVSETSTTSKDTSTDKLDMGSIIGGVSSIEDKRVRSLLKKLRSIETLKMKQAYGEPLEETQVSKIHKEDEIRKELASLGWTE